MSFAVSLAKLIGLLLLCSCIQERSGALGDVTMYRDIINELLKWRDSIKRKPLLLTGVRQCGKTYIVKEFGRDYFDNYIYVNFEENKQLAAIFEYDLNPVRIIEEIKRIMQCEIIIGQTLVFFDEIQACPNAITALKYFCENMPKLHVVGAGSLLGVALKHQQVSFPVGKVSRMRLHPLSFREFVIACGGEKYLDLFKNWDVNREIPQLYAKPMADYLRDYYIVGGMPEAVMEWIGSHSYDNVEDIQRNILEDYSNDFAKYAPIANIPKLHMIWDSIPVQLAKENNKFMFSHVGKGKRSADLEDALQWLIDAGLAYKLPLTENAALPLSANASGTGFKLYMSDVGLLRVRSNIDYRTIKDGSNLFREYKGALVENYVLDELIGQGIVPFYWRSGNTAELDFIFDWHNNIVPVEVKAADNVQAKSYRLFCKKTAANIGFKLSMKNIAENMCESTRTINLPLYLAWNIKEYIHDT